LLNKDQMASMIVNLSTRHKKLEKMWLYIWYDTIVTNRIDKTRLKTNTKNMQRYTRERQ